MIIQGDAKVTANGSAENGIAVHGWLSSTISIKGGTLDIAGGQGAFSEVPNLEENTRWQVLAGDSKEAATSWDGMTGLNNYKK